MPSRVRSESRPYSALLVGAALTCIVGEYLRLPAVVYVAKPLATLATIAIAGLAAHPVSPRYRALITAGLVASLAGDVFLMIPGDRFVAGLVSFLVAHLLYVAAFASEGGGLRNAAAALPIGAFAIGMLAYLWPDLGAMRLPVAAYVAVIGAIGWQAFARWGRSPGSELAAFGAISFLLSDSALAVGRFKGPFDGDRALVLGTYWIAQWCIARSVRGKR